MGCSPHNRERVSARFWSPVAPPISMRSGCSVHGMSASVCESPTRRYPRRCCTNSIAAYRPAAFLDKSSPVAGIHRLSVPGSFCPRAESIYNLPPQQILAACEYSSEHHDGFPIAILAPRRLSLFRHEAGCAHRPLTAHRPSTVRGSP